MTSTNIARIFASFFGIGFLPKAPGTFGTVAGLIAWYYLGLVLNPNYISFVFFALTFLSFLAVQFIVAANPENKDPQYIVVDEVVGIWLACATLTPPAVFSFESLAPWILAFALFRFFDIKKPWLVGRAEKLPGAFGIMADDIVAGVFSLVIMIICQLIIQ